MANTMRWRYGETNPVLMPVATDDKVEIGDLLFLEGSTVKVSANQTDQGSLAANQELFHDNFVGVAMQASPAGEATDIRVATSGVFEFESTQATYEVGDLLGVADDGSGGELEEQTLEAVATANLAVGRCVKRTSSGSEKVLVDIVSTVVRGGPQTAA